LARVGARAGCPAAVLSAGKGTVAIAVTTDGQVHSVGQWLGGEDGVAWIGFEGVCAALRGRDGRGPRTVLETRAEEGFGDLAALARTLSLDGNAARSAATSAGVVYLASSDDETAGAVQTECARRRRGRLMDRG